MLRPLSVQLFEKLDDTLFDRSGSSFQQFFEGMRVLRKNRDALFHSWFERLDEAWKQLKPQIPGAFRPRLVSAAGAPVDAATHSGEFALIDEVTLERKLAIDSSVARGLSLCRMELPPLCHRLSVLRNGVAVAQEEVPAAPLLLLQTFSQSLDDVQNLPVEVALVVFKLFDRVVMNAVDAICKELNRILVVGGVAPRWTWSPGQSHRAGGARHSMPAASAQVESWDEQQAWLDTVPGLEQAAPGHFAPGQFGGMPGGGFMPNGFAEVVEQARLSASVRALLEHRRAARYAASWAQASGLAHARSLAAAEPAWGEHWGGDLAGMPGQSLDLEAVMEVLAAMPMPELPTSWIGEPEEAPWDPGLLKQELSRSLHQRMHPAGANAPAPAETSHEFSLGEHEDVIDMVAMMFSFIQQDQALPAAVQALVSRLQLPYLRLALTDSHLFSDAAHPARALMDRLAEVGKSCAPDSPMLAEKMLKMHSLVGRIVGSHDTTRAFFEQEWVKFRTWSDALTQRAAARERDQVTALIESNPQVLAAETSAAQAVQNVVDDGHAAVHEHVAAEHSVLPELLELLEPAPSPQPSVDAAAERARLHQIRLGVTARMRGRLEGRMMPEGLRHALSLLWVNHQVRVWDAHGERSYEASWLDRQLDAVVGLLTAQSGAKAQDLFAQDWPGIERAWTQVLADGSAPAAAQARWIATFRRWAEIQTGLAIADSSAQWNWLEGLTAARSGEAQPLPAAPAATAQIGEAPRAESAAASEPARSMGVAKPIHAKPSPARWTVGDWIEFKEDSAEQAAVPQDAATPAPRRIGRGKVSWIGSFTGRTILVKTDGTLWREEGRSELDDLIDRGLAFIVPRESLFDRSMQSIFEKLREDVAPEPEPAT